MGDGSKWKQRKTETRVEGYDTKGYEFIETKLKNEEFGGNQTGCSCSNHEKG